MLRKNTALENNLSRAVLFFRSKGLHMSTISSAPTATQSISRFINEKQVAELLGISVKTVQAWRLKSIGPRYWRLHNKLVRYQWQDVLDYLEGTAVTPNRALHRAFPSELVEKHLAESHDSAHQA